MEPQPESNSNPTAKRRGRPRLHDVNGVILDSHAQRRMRVRLAQRAYRSRQKTKLQTQERAIQRVEAALTKLNNHATEHRLSEVLPLFALEFSRTLQTITEFTRSQSTNSSSDTDLSPSDHGEGDWDVLSENLSNLVGSQLHHQEPSSFPDLVATDGRTEISKQIISGSDSTPSMSLPFTYNFQEKTFPRRLRRSCIEWCYRYLSSWDSKPRHLARKLGLRLASMTIEELRARAKAVLLRSTDEPLTYKIGSGPEPPNLPGKSALLPRVEQRACSLRLLLPSCTATGVFMIHEIHEPGYEGIWLEPEEVTLYLERLGISVQHNCSKVAVQWNIPLHVLLQMIPQSAAALPFLTFNHASQMVAVDINLDHLVEYLTKVTVCVEGTCLIRKDELDGIIKHAVIAWLSSITQSRR